MSLASGVGIELLTGLISALTTKGTYDSKIRSGAQRARGSGC